MKYGGLSQLADVARDLTQPKEACYPIRRKGERRRLNPNLDGIRFLEGETFEQQTAIYHRAHYGNGLTVLYARGYFTRGCNRPMIQVIDDSTRPFDSPDRTPCEDCDNVAYTSKCPGHPEPVVLAVRDVLEIVTAVPTNTVRRAYDVSTLTFE